MGLWAVNFGFGQDMEVPAIGALQGLHEEFWWFMRPKLGVEFMFSKS